MGHERHDQQVGNQGMGHDHAAALERRRPRQPEGNRPQQRRLRLPRQPQPLHRPSGVRPHDLGPELHSNVLIRHHLHHRIVARQRVGSRKCLPRQSGLHHGHARAGLHGGHLHRLQDGHPFHHRRGKQQRHFHHAGLCCHGQRELQGEQHHL